METDTQQDGPIQSFPARTELKSKRARKHARETDRRHREKVAHTDKGVLWRTGVPTRSVGTQVGNAAQQLTSEQGRAVEQAITLLRKWLEGSPVDPQMAHLVDSNVLSIAVALLMEEEPGTQHATCLAAMVRARFVLSGLDISELPGLGGYCTTVLYLTDSMFKGTPVIQMGGVKLITLAVGGEKFCGLVQRLQFLASGPSAFLAFSHGVNYNRGHATPSDLRTLAQSVQQEARRVVPFGHLIYVHPPTISTLSYSENNKVRRAAEVMTDYVDRVLCIPDLWQHPACFDQVSKPHYLKATRDVVATWVAQKLAGLLHG